MAKITFSCPRCGTILQRDDNYHRRKIKCRHCRCLIPIPADPARKLPLWLKRWKAALAAALSVAVLVAAAALAWILLPRGIDWPDRRPIGVLFLASNHHCSPTNPRGWFNDPTLDFTGTNGAARVHQALMDYADRSIAILRRTGAQGVIVWDLEGEQFPQKTSFIGDPRALDRLAPEMAAAADDFFARLRNAGFRVGLTIRPQQLVFDDAGIPRQTAVWNSRPVLLAKIDYARRRWGATIFYIDSNGGVRQPGELFQLRLLADECPDVLLIPEHSYFFYSAFSAPYLSLRRGDRMISASLARTLLPRSGRAIDISDASDAAIAEAEAPGDILLFRAWMWSPECDYLARLSPQTDSSGDLMPASTPVESEK